MLSKAIIFREMKSESGFSFAMASQPFAKSTVEKSRHGDMFKKLEKPHQRRGNVNKEWREPTCHTKRHLKSALPYLTRLLNGEAM